ncbi:hypothetical protein Tco_0804712 [Tanacetum coccineum]|uniref:Uncharacterized protein n=1 Tax=Tanacetum coccineum TaxID=301880 RepID=A0ABQ5A522_9ASTR
METNKSINRSAVQKNLYNALVKAYNSYKDIIALYGDVDAEPSKGSKSKELKSSSSSKGTQSQPKSSGKSTQAEEPEFEAADTKMQQDQGNESGHIDDQPDNEAAPKHDWFQKPNKPSTADRAWNKLKSIDFIPPQKWISTIAKARQPPRTFKKLMGTPIDFSAYAMNHLKIDNLTQEILVRHAFNLLKGSCKSFAELEYHFEECYKAINDRLDWHNPEGHEYPFDHSKPLPLIKDQRTSSIEDMVPTLWIPVKVAYNKHVVWGTYHWGLKFYEVGLTWVLEEMLFEEINNVLLQVQVKAKIPRLKLCVIKICYFSFSQKKLSNLDVDNRNDLVVGI